METGQAKFEGWAIVELMGHQREAGYVTTEAYGQAVLFRVDVPEIPEREETLAREAWTADHYAQAGSKVLRGRVAPRSRLISPAAVYALNPCTEEAVRLVVANVPRSLILLEAPKDRTLLPGEPQPAEDEGDEL
jgi:hypothetical protein